MEIASKTAPFYNNFQGIAPLEPLEGVGILCHPKEPFYRSPTWPFKAIYGLITFTWP